MSNELWRLSAADMQRRYRDGSLSPVAVAEACLARLDAVNPAINAVVLRRDEAFLREALDSEKRHQQGRPLSPVDGVPLTVKDSLLTRDLPTSWGTPALRAYNPPGEELSVSRVRAAGALMLGKTNVPEFALEGYTANPIHGATGNPWNPRLTPGGSSGGAVAAVAAGIAPLAIGQDGGGSIRRPASHTGLVGLKPSLSAVPREHVLPSLLLDFEVIGPLTRTVADARLLFDVMRGPSGMDRLSCAAAFAAAAQPNRDRMRILYVERFGAAPLDREIAASVRTAVERLAALGHDVEEGPLPLDLDFYAQAWPQIGQAGLASLFQTHPGWASQASRKYLDMAQQGRDLPAWRLWEILEQVKALRRASTALFDRYDLVVTPSAGALPWPAEEAYPPTIDGQEVGPRGHAVYTGWVNAAGLPAVALPCDPSHSGLPIGMQVVGRYGSDDQLLTLGTAYEMAHPWAHRWPPIA